jgi:hypothetical protein
MDNLTVYLGDGNPNTAKVNKIGKTGKAKRIVRNRQKNEASFNVVANKCDRAVNRKASRKAKRKARFEARQK